MIILYRRRRADAKTIAQELVSAALAKRDEETEAFINRIKESFGALSYQALSQNTQEFLKIAEQVLQKHTQQGENVLENKKSLIDHSLAGIKEELNKVEEVISQFEKDRQQKFGELSSQLRLAAEQARSLEKAASKLNSAFVNTKVRGAWGEKIAEDILKASGFVEGVNYLKQKKMSAQNFRPDYTFFLPKGLKVNMDVKFPLNNYWRYQETENEGEKKKYKEQFLKDVRQRVKEVTTKDYINPEEGTVDYVIVFIPNEYLYSFIHQGDPQLLDDALQNKVILCSPFTLYAVLAVIRQAADNFSLEKATSRILALLGEFRRQMDSFDDVSEKLGKKIEDLQKVFIELTTTRRNKLERVLQKIEEARRQKNIPEIDTAQSAEQGNPVSPSEKTSPSPLN